MNLDPAMNLPIKYATIIPQGERIEFYGVSRAHEVYFFTLNFLSLDSCAVVFPRRWGKIGPGLLRTFEACLDNYYRFLFINGLTRVLFVVSFARLSVHCLVFRCRAEAYLECSRLVW